MVASLTAPLNSCSVHEDTPMQQGNDSTAHADLAQVTQATPIMGMKQLVRHISPSPYVKDHEDLAITALPAEKPMSKVNWLEPRMK